MFEPCDRLEREYTTKSGTTELDNGWSSLRVGTLDVERREGYPGAEH